MNFGDERYKECKYCGEKLLGNLEIFCVLPYEISARNICWCVCNQCRRRFLADKLPESTISNAAILANEQSTTFGECELTD